MTETINKPIDNNIPDPSQVERGEGIPSYRIASGKLLKGSEKAGNLEELEKIVGRLLRIGFQEGTNKEGKYFSQLEADFQTSSGVIRVKTNTSNAGAFKVGVAALSFAKALVVVKPGDLIQVEAQLASKPNSHGNYSTYANLSNVTKDEKTGKWRTRWVDKYEIDKSFSMDEQWKILLSDLEKHEAWQVREMGKSDGDDDGHSGGGNSGGEYLAPWDRAAYKAAEPALVKAGWPEFHHGTKDAWLAFASAAAQQKFGSVDDIPEAFWSGLVAYLPQAKEVPAVLAAVKVAPAAAAAPVGGFNFGGNDDYNPFEDK